MSTQFFLKLKISDVGCYSFLMVIIMSHLHSCFMVLKSQNLLKIILYTAQCKMFFFQFPFLIDKPICIRAASLFLTIHLLDRRHCLVVESNQVSLAWFAFGKFMLAFLKHLLDLTCRVPQEFQMGKLYSSDMYATRKRIVAL